MIMGAIQEKQDFLSKELICALTGNTGCDPKRGSPLDYFEEGTPAGAILEELRRKVGKTTRLKLSALWPYKCKSFKPPEKYKQVLGYAPPEPHMSLGHCLRAYAKEEPLDGPNKAFCQRCEILTRSSKSVKVAKAP